MKDVDYIKSRVSCSDYAERIGLKVSKYRRCDCPLCDGESKNTLRLFDPVQDGGKTGFYCFRCHNGGDIIRFAQLTQGLTFPEAVNHLIEMYGLDVERMSPEQIESQTRRKRETERLELLRLYNLSINLYNKVCETNRADLIPSANEILTGTEMMLNAFR